MKKRVLLGLLAIFSTFTSCEEKVKNNESHPEEAITKSWIEFGNHWEQEAVEELVLLYTEDGMNVPPEGEILIGREAISGFYEFLFSNHLPSTYRHEIKSIQAADSMAIEYGEFTVNWVRNDSTPWTFSGRSMTHWVKVEGDKWQIKKFLFNSPPASEADQAQ